MDYLEEKPLRPKRPKKKKPFVIEYRWAGGDRSMRMWWPKDWTKWGAYATERGARDALKSAKKHDFLKFRMKPTKTNSK